MDNILDLFSQPPLEQRVSAYLGRDWQVKSARHMAGFACHPCAILSDGLYSVFAKFSDALNGGEQFEVELWRVWGYLAAVTVEGQGYLSRLAGALEKYV